MMKIEINKAPLHVIDYLVAKCEGIAVVWQGSGFTLFAKDPDDEEAWSPTSNALQGQHILERERIELHNAADNLWAGHSDTQVYGMGKTQLDAGLRCYLIKYLGWETEVPDDLVNMTIHSGTLPPGNGNLIKMKRLLRQAHVITVGDSRLLTLWAFIENINEDSEDEEILRVAWTSDDGLGYSAIFTVGGIKAGEWLGNTFTCEDHEGDKTAIRFFTLTELS